MNATEMYLERIARALETQNMLTLINSGRLTKAEEDELINKVKMNNGLKPNYASDVQTLADNILDDPYTR